MRAVHDSAVLDTINVPTLIHMRHEKQGRFANRPYVYHGTIAPHAAANPRLRPCQESVNHPAMINDRAYWEAWESQGPLREPLDPQRAIRLGDAMYEYARALGAFPPADPLEGLETKIAIARVVNSLPPHNGGK